MTVDEGRIEKAVREIIEAIGEDPDRDGLQNTPARVARMYGEIFSGLGQDPSQVLTVTFEADHDEMVMVRDIPFHSACEHHLVPFIGKAHVAYIPGDDGRISPRKLHAPKRAKDVSIHHWRSAGSAIERG